MPLLTEHTGYEIVSSALSNVTPTTINAPTGMVVASFYSLNGDDETHTAWRASLTADGSGRNIAVTFITGGNNFTGHVVCVTP